VLPIVSISITQSKKEENVTIVMLLVLLVLEALLTNVHHAKLDLAYKELLAYHANQPPSNTLKPKKEFVNLIATVMAKEHVKLVKEGNV